MLLFILGQLVCHWRNKLPANTDIKLIIEGAIFAADQPVTIEQLIKMLEPAWQVNKEQVHEAIQNLVKDYEGRGVQLKEIATGFRFQVSQDVSPFIGKLWEERPAKYSRALLETLALIVYRQPITRAEIEDVRGVAVSTTIIKTLAERDWIRVIGYKDMPGKPALFATTKNFLNDFNLKSLSELPPLAEVVDIEKIGERAEQALESENFVSVEEVL